MRSIFIRALLVLALAVPTACGKSGPSSSEIDAALRSRLAALKRGAASVRGERLLQPAALARFYQARNGAHAWDGGDAGEIVQAVRDIGQDGLNPADYHLAALERLGDPGKAGANPALAGDLDLLLTDAVAGMMDHIRFGRVRPVTLDSTWNVDPRAGAPPLEATLARIAEAGSPRQAIEERKPTHFIYVGLKRALAELRGVRAPGGWPRVPAGKTIRPGVSDPRIPAIRARLAATGELRGVQASSTAYDPELRKAVELFQTRHRLDPDGMIDRSVTDAMNVSAAARADQVRVNLERARWVLPGLGDEFLLVNLPAYKAYLIRGGRNVWETRTQIGDEGKQTPSFRATLRTVVFNPDWTVPPMILRDEVARGMRGGKNYMAEKGLVVLDKEGREVDPASVDWSQTDADDFPFTVKQPPGPDNALGKVKFLFPNPYSIYLHDTPSKGSFEAEKRTFSHGCIRIEHPLELAQLLLAGQDSWDGAKIQDAVRDGATQSVDLARPIPVVIVYWTVSVGSTGETRYMRDIYGLDARVLAALRARR
jgi:murein L,D-transpeptidase YcbB/YkuD